ncbi:MAG: acetoacetate decarboxylase family protein [Acidimicrobiales bacterium]
MTVRYAAVPPKPAPADGAGAGTPSGIETWSTSLTATFLTDPEAVASVLPPPLSPPAEPVVKVGVSQVDLGGRMPPFGAGTFAVAARHGDVDGFYPLLMPMTTEQAVIGGREIFGEPKKLAKIALDREGDALHATVARLGTTIIEITGTVGEALPVPEAGESIDFYLKFLRSPDGEGFDDEPWLVHCTREGRTRSHHAVTGTLELRDSRFDPVADFPILSEPAMTISERTSTQRGALVQRVPADDVLPFVHQRYDDLIVAAGKGR